MKAAYSKAKGGREKKELDSRVRRFHILEGMAISVKDLERENEIIHDELKNWRENFNNLKEKEKLYREMLSVLEQKNDKIRNLNQVNKEHK